VTPAVLKTLPARLAALPQRTILLPNEPRAGEGAGKGANVRAAIAHLLQKGECEIIATQDCDVASFRRVDLARLCYAIAHPSLGYRFAKMYYSRVTDRLYGRVSRLFLAPMLHAVLRVAGHQPLVDFLLSFRYPLAGEVALTRELAAALPVSSGWGLEIGQLCEVFRRVDPREVCQVDGGPGYDHKHQPAATALADMAAEIARELFAQLAAEGLARDEAFHAAVATAYRREAAHALRRSASLALINGLPFDEPAERAIVETFAARLAR
jgi:glucosyl-3-phosphoglycerate synthase